MSNKTTKSLWEKNPSLSISKHCIKDPVTSTFFLYFPPLLALSDVLKYDRVNK